MIIKAIILTVIVRAIIKAIKITRYRRRRVHHAQLSGMVMNTERGRRIMLKSLE